MSEQIEVKIRQHALEAGCFVVSATARLDAVQQSQVKQDTGCPIGPISSCCFTAIVSPQGQLMREPLRSGEGAVIADLDFALVDERRRSMESNGHHGRPELLSLLIDRTPAEYVHVRRTTSKERMEIEIRQIHVDRWSVISSRPFDEIVSALDGAIGHPNIRTLLAEAEAGLQAR